MEEIFSLFRQARPGINFFESHDTAGNDGGWRMQEQMSPPKFRQALALLYAAPGVPTM